MFISQNKMLRRGTKNQVIWMFILEQFIKTSKRSRETRMKWLV